METNNKSNTSHYLYGFIFIFVGIAIAAIMLLMAKSESDKKKEWTPTQAVIQDIDKKTYKRKKKRRTSYTVYITYTYNGEEYRDKLNNYNSSMDIGEEITIYVNPKNPSEQTSGSVFTLVAFGAAFGILFPLAGIHIITANTKEKAIPDKDSQSS